MSGSLLRDRGTISRSFWFRRDGGGRGATFVVVFVAYRRANASVSTTSGGRLQCRRARLTVGLGDWSDR